MSLFAALLIGICVAVIGFVALVFLLRRGSDPDLGSVSGQWVAEHRASQIDSPR